MELVSRTLSEPHLGAGVFILCASTQQVSSQQDARDGRRAALLAHVAEVTRHCVHQQLQSQHALCSAAAQPQTRGQEHEPADGPISTQ